MAPLEVQIRNGCHLPTDAPLDRWFCESEQTAPSSWWTHFTVGCKAGQTDCGLCFSVTLVEWWYREIWLRQLRSLGRIKEGPAVGGVCPGNCGQFRTGLAEKLNVSRANDNKKREFSGWESSLDPELALSQALAWALRLFFLEYAWMIMLQLPAFPSGQYFGWEGCKIPGVRLAWWGWQAYSLDVLEGTGSEAEACHYSKVV